MNFLQLEYFLEVAGRLSVTKAAESLHVSQSALSQTLRKLESEFGVSFFHRRSTGLELTEAGETFMRYARRTLRERDELRHRLRQRPDEIRGEIVIQSNPIPYLIADHFLHFRRRYPATEIRFVSVPELLINDYSRDPFLSVSLLVTTEPPVRSDTETRFLLRERFMAALPRSHPLAGRASISLRELRDEPFLIYEKGEVQRAVEHCCTDAGFTPQVACVCHDLGTSHGMDDIRFTAFTLLAFMTLVRILECGSNLGKVGGGVIGADGFFQQVILFQQRHFESPRFRSEASFSRSR